MTTIFQIAEKNIRDDIRQIENVLTNNRVKDMDHYRYLTGQLKGLTVALGIFKDLEAKVNNDEDWDN